MPATDLTQTIINSASGMSSATVDGVTVTAIDSSKLIQIDQYLAAKAAASLKTRGLRFTYLRPPGAVTFGFQGTRGTSTRVSS